MKQGTFPAPGNNTYKISDEEREKMMELLAGKAGLWDGERKFGTIFGGTDIEDCAEELIRRGFNYSGKDVFYSGGAEAAG